nr:PREDICTED: uncharacterized protein LOC105670991 isoform X3 [Linepithema humile]
MKRVIERRRGPKGIQAPSEQHCGIVTTWRTVRSETPLGVVGVVAVVAADPSPPLSNTYAPPKADFTMDCTTIPTEARLPMISIGENGDGCDATVSASEQQEHA